MKKKKPVHLGQDRSHKHAGAFQILGLPAACLTPRDGIEEINIGKGQRQRQIQTKSKEKDKDKGRNTSQPPVSRPEYSVTRLRVIRPPVSTIIDSLTFFNINF